MRFPFASHLRSCFGVVALALLANGKKPVAAAQLTALVASVPRAVALSALGSFPSKAGQQVTLTWSSKKRHIHHFCKPSVGTVAGQGFTTLRPSFNRPTYYCHRHRSQAARPMPAPKSLSHPATPLPTAVREPSQDEISVRPTGR